MQTHRLAIPNIDLGATFKVIDETVTPPRWKTVARDFATRKNAKKIMEQQQLAGVWMFNDLGEKQYFTHTA